MNIDNWFLKSKYFKISIPKPMVQATVIQVSSLLMMSGSLVFNDENWAWTVAGALILLFVVFNNALAIFADSFRNYVQYSIYGFMGMLMISGVFAYLFSGKSIFADRGVDRTIFLVLILAYFSLLAIAFFIRNVADFLKKRDDEMQQKGRL